MALFYDHGVFTALSEMNVRKKKKRESADYWCFLLNQNCTNGLTKLKGQCQLSAWQLTTHTVSRFQDLPGRWQHHAYRVTTGVQSHRGCNGVDTGRINTQILPHKSPLHPHASSAEWWSRQSYIFTAVATIHSVRPRRHHWLTDWLSTHGLTVQQAHCISHHVEELPQGAHALTSLSITNHATGM